MLNYSKIPAELQALSNWCVTDGNSKIPVRCASDHRFARCNHPEDVTDFQTAVKWYQSGKYSGISFLCGNGFSFIDLDHVIDDSGAVSVVAESILKQFDGKAYIEKSRSGGGFHIITRGSIPQAVKSKQVEIYSEKHFCAVTADIYGSSADAFPDMSKSLETLARWIISQREKNKPQERASFPQKTGVSLSVAEIIDKAINARNGAKFAALLSGNWQGLGIGDGSQSCADMSFANMLSFWFANRADAESVFEQSGMFRDHRRMRLALDKAYGDSRDHYILNR